MPFNSDTYYGNNASRSAWAWLAMAKDVKARAARGEAYDWEIARLPTLVIYARADMRTCLFYRRQRRGK